ncbi:MAG: hypothetical protein AMXMBFR46_28090 [Acidimicrobiia bacterium]
MISVVIPARNEASAIGSQLAALAAQVCGDDSEVIVADNGSTDATAEIAHQWRDRLPVRVVDASARRGPAAARNIAASAARGELLVFVDADDVVMPGFMDAWRALPESVVFASGPVVFFPVGTAPPRSSERAATQPPVQLGFLPYALGAVFAVRRDWFERAGGFDESYRTAEDVELSWRLQGLGAELTFVPGAAVAKREAPSTGATLRQYFRYGLRDPYLYRDFRDAGVPRPTVWPTVRSYAGIVARLPLLWHRAQRRRWAHQAARRVGRLVGSARAQAWYP